MPLPPDPAVLYPDVAAHGSLVAALRPAAGPLRSAEPEAPPGPAALRRAAIASPLPYRGPLEISAWAHERRWSIWGADSFQRLPLIDGHTDDLSAVAAAARAWHDGAALDDLGRAAPFVHPTGRFEVPELDAARLVESEWRALRQEASELRYDWQPAYHALMEAAHAEPALRALYPFTSHWVLRFSSTTRPHLTVVGPCVMAGSHGTYGVGTGFPEPDLGWFATAPEAVAAAARQLPPAPDSVSLGR